MTENERVNMQREMQKKETADILLEIGCGKQDAAELLSEVYGIPEEKAKKYVRGYGNEEN